MEGQAALEMYSRNIDAILQQRLATFLPVKGFGIDRTYSIGNQEAWTKVSS